MNSVAHLVPKADPEMEQVISTTWGLYEVIKWLNSRGVVWNEPPADQPPLTLDEQRTIVRVILRELRMRENAEGTSHALRHDERGLSAY